MGGRIMDRNGHSDVKMFFGMEVEHTPAHRMETLFVVGIQPISDIEQEIDNCSVSCDIEHIYFGANQSFIPLQPYDAERWEKWEKMIKHFLEAGYFVTLDIPVSSAEGLLESGLTEYNRFIPMISVKLPYINQYGYNAVLKIDDKDFAASNPGVWCHQLHDLQDRNVFTHWSAYDSDEVLK